MVDEIGGGSVSVQIKLLRVLQEGSLTPVGSHDEQRFEGRVIAATHRTLDELRASGRFREEFYYRLSSEVVSIPPLRQRIADSPSELPPLARVLLQHLVGEVTDRTAERVCEVLRRDVPPGYA